MSEEEVDEEIASDGDADDTKKPRRKRGTSFPVVPLSEAARILKEAGKYGFEHPTPAFASYMGHSTTNSGAFRQRLSAFRDWGLITGRGDMLTMTEVARMIAMPTDPDAERRAMQEAFRDCDVFTRLYDQTAKGQPLNPERLGGRAVHELGVTPAKSGKFIESFIESALAAELAELDDNDEVVLWGPVNSHGAPDAPVNEGGASLGPTTGVPSPTGPSPADASQAPIRRVDAVSGAPTIHQSWPIAGGEIVFELRSDHALPAAAFAAIGEVVARMEALATSLSADVPAGPRDEIEP